jgi:uncharacterized membrane protein YphA (DoxX/SURF4 family)
MRGLGYACAVLLAMVFVRAGAAKLARPAQTAASFVALRIPAPDALARAVPFVELAVAAALLAAPTIGGVAANVLLAGFTVALAGALRAGVTAPCNCFGAARADPVSPVDIVRNLLLAVLGVAAIPTPEPVRPGLVAIVVAAVAFAAGFAALAAGRRRMAR